MEEAEVEIPEYFICPISLQIMRDPVTAITGITYDRDSIEHWIFTNHNTTCPVTKQPLPPDSDLTPNHTLRRLIQSWCTLNALHRIPTPKPPLDKPQVLKLLKQLHHHHQPDSQLHVLRHLEFLAAADNHRNTKCLLDAGVPTALLLFILNCYTNRHLHDGLQEALSLLQFVKPPADQVNLLLSQPQNHQILDSLAWILDSEINKENWASVKSHALLVLKTILQRATCNAVLLERLKPEFVERIVRVLRSGITQQGVNAGLKVLVAACPWGRNREMMVEAGAVMEMIQIELDTPEKRTTELTVEVLFHLCSCSASGRAQFVSHRGGIAVLTERLFKISEAVDHRALFILSHISNNNTSSQLDMLKLGTAAKLCMLLQTDRSPYLKHKALEILKSHSHLWNHSPCFPHPSFYSTFPN